MSSLFKGGGEESNRVQRVKTKLERWKVQAVDMVCGKYFHHPSSFQFLCLVIHYPCVPFLPIPFLYSSYLLIVLPFTGLHIHTTVSVLLCLSVQLSVYWSDVRLIIIAHQSISPSFLPSFFTNLTYFLSLFPNLYFPKLHSCSSLPFFHVLVL